jgi:cell division initiation protein
MRLSALDIKKKEFQQKLRDSDEVQAFLDQVSEEVELLAQEKLDLTQKLSATEERLAHYTSLEQTIEKTLAASQQTAVVMEEQARREADLIAQGARLERDRILSEARLELDRMQSALLRSKGEYQSMIVRIRSTMVGFDTFIRSLEQEMNPVSTTAADVPGVVEFHE